MTTGRPRASSRETISEAACELFLERGYDNTSVRDIALRAGVSRSTFFNYFSSKADVLWGGLDERIQQLGETLGAGDVAPALSAMADGLVPDGLALGIVHAAPMGLEDELELEAAIRRSRIARIVEPALRRSGMDRLQAEIAAAAYGAAVLAAVGEWARTGAARTSLAEVVARAVALVVEGPARA